MIIRDYYEQLCSNKLDNLEEMDTFLETYKLPELNHEEKENLNRSYKQGDRISIKKTPNNKKSPEPDGLTGEFY